MTYILNIKWPAGNSGSQPMRVSEGSQASAPACRHLCQRTGTQARNPALAVAANVVAHWRNTTKQSDKIKYPKLGSSNYSL
jgi:hypothetical protein